MKTVIVVNLLTEKAKRHADERKRYCQHHSYNPDWTYAVGSKSVWLTGCDKPADEQRSLLYWFMYNHDLAEGVDYTYEEKQKLTADDRDRDCCYWKDCKYYKYGIQCRCKEFEDWEETLNYYDDEE